ncbi:QueT transporter family protein [Eubacteriales bacterium OttesenSCG-928-N14]|nr:QueT transporter family protein [Eubacteriales bacterium OttesenSCG-928-N14]
MKWNAKAIALSAVIAALYTLLTLAFAPIAFKEVQVRISEAMYALALFTPAAIPGLGVGCLVANILASPLGPIDWVLGTLATLIGATLVYLLRQQKPLLALLPPVLSNAVLVALVLAIAEGLPYIPSMLYIGLGEAIACLALGYPLYRALQRIGAQKWLV